jgi:hypothetical protein
MRLLPWLALSLLALPTLAHAIVIRPGVSDWKYVIPDNSIPAFVDLPGEGQGALIAAHGVVTTAHATQGYKLTQVRIHG